VKAEPTAAKALAGAAAADAEDEPFGEECGEAAEVVEVEMGGGDAQAVGEVGVDTESERLKAEAEAEAEEWE
jgi:hypothetical protein